MPSVAQRQKKVEVDLDRPLSPRTMQIIEGLAADRSVREIAREFDVSDTWVRQVSARHKDLIDQIAKGSGRDA